MVAIDLTSNSAKANIWNKNTRTQNSKGRTFGLFRDCLFKAWSPGERFLDISQPVPGFGVEIRCWAVLKYSDIVTIVKDKKGHVMEHSMKNHELNFYEKKTKV